MQIKYTSSSSMLTAEVSGSLDQVTLRNDFWLGMPKDSQALAIKTKAMSVNLDGVKHVDTAGLAWLINLVADTKKANIQVTFHNMPSKLMELAKLSNADGIIS